MKGKLTWATWVDDYGHMTATTMSMGVAEGNTYNFTVLNKGGMSQFRSQTEYI